jgi:hypothetical protein
MPVFTLQAISVKGRLMVMLRGVKSVTTGGITFATGENPRFLLSGQNPKNPRPSSPFPLRSLWRNGVAASPADGLTVFWRGVARRLGRYLYF